MPERPRRLALLAALAFTAAVLVHFHDRFWWPPDEGAYAHVAERLLAGEVLHRDVQDVHAGYINLLNAASFKAFGMDLLSLRYPLVAAGLLQALLLFFAFPRRRPLLAATAVIALTSLSQVQFLDPTAHWYCLPLAAATVWVLGRDRPQRSSGDLWTGALIGTTFLFRQLTGVFLGLGVLAYRLLEEYPGTPDREDGRRLLPRLAAGAGLAGLLLYLAGRTDLFAAVVFGAGPLALLGAALWRPVPDSRRTLGMLTRLGAGFCLALAPLALYHLAHGSVGAWADDALLRAAALPTLPFVERARYAADLASAAANLVTWRSTAAAWNGLFWSSLLLAPLALGLRLLRTVVAPGAGHTPASPPAPAPQVAPERASATPRRALRPLPVLAAFYALVSVHYQIPIYLFYGAGLVIAALLATSAGTSRGRRASAAALALLLSATALVFHAAQPLDRGLDGTLAGRRAGPPQLSGLNRAHLRIEPAEARRYRRLVTLIEDRTEPADAIFALPFDPELYFLSRRRNPFRFFNTALGVPDEAALTGVLSALAARPPRLVIFRPDDKYNTPASRRIMERVRQDYVLLERRDGFEIYRRPTP